jgi:uncharacterized protein
VDATRHRFGSGQYRYFPDPVARLREALYPRLLPIARDWYDRLGRATEWPDTLAEWLDMCHAAGQTRPTPILLRYQAGDWNALHRDLCRVVILDTSQLAADLRLCGRYRGSAQRRRHHTQVE